MTTTNYFNAIVCLEMLIISKLTVSASTTSLPAWTYSSCKESTCIGCSNTTSGAKHPARRYPRLSNSKTYPSETIMFSPSCILSRKPQKEREKNAVKQLNHFSTIMRDLLLDYWFKNQHLGLYCWTGDAKVNTEGFTAKLVMQKSIPRFFLPNWWCKSQHRCFHCWTGDANVNIEGFTAGLVMQKSTTRYLQLNW